MLRNFQINTTELAPGQCRSEQCDAFVIQTVSPGWSIGLLSDNRKHEETLPENEERLRVLGEAIHDTSHLESHMQENYVVPSLVYNAMVSCGYDPQRNIQFAMVFGQMNCSSKLAQSTVERSVYRYMCKQFGFAV